MKLDFVLATILAASIPLVAADSIPSGTSITIRTIDKISSTNADLNKRYHASLDEPVVVDGKEIAARGANVDLIVAEARNSGRISGRAALVLRVAAISVNGQMIPVQTGDSVSESASQGKKTAKRAAIGAGAGAILGGIIGGGKGAAIGAGAGGAAGTATALGGEKVTVPSETRLTFTLSSSAPLVQ